MTEALRHKPRKSHSLQFEAALRNRPHLTATFNSNRTRLFIYYRQEQQPRVIATVTDNGYRANGRTFDNLSTLMEYADNECSRCNSKSF